MFGHVGGLLPDPLEDDLCEHGAGDLLPARLVDDPDVLAENDEVGDALQRDVVPSPRVVQLAVLVALDQALIGSVLATSHDRNLTHCVINVKLE